MAIKKSQLYSTLWESCNALRGSMDASQYKDYVLMILFVKYLSDKARQGQMELDVPDGCYFEDFVALKQNPHIGEKINEKLEAIREANTAFIGGLLGKSLSAFAAVAFISEDIRSIKCIGFCFMGIITSQSNGAFSQILN